MELNDALRRIVGQHWRLLGICLIAGALLSLLFAPQGTLYSASARLVLDTADPATRQESGVIADTAKAIVTSPSLAQSALRNAGVERGDPGAFARKHVSVAALGTSGVLQLSVTDRNRQVAASVANALAASLIRTRLDVTNGETQQVLADLDRRTAALSEKISKADESVNTLSLQMATASTAEAANGLRDKRNEAARSRDFLAEQRGVLESERVSLLSTSALRPKPSIISPATPPANAESSHRLSYLILGALLGFVAGMGLAGAIEAFRPTLVGSDALAGELDAALLGTLPSAAATDATATDIGVRLRLAAEAAGVENVGLLAAGPDVDLGSLAESLTAAQPAPAGGRRKTGSSNRNGHQRNGHQAGVAIRPFSPSLSNGSRPSGLVLVAPSVLKKTELVDASQFLKVANLPLLGVIAYGTPGFDWREFDWREFLGSERSSSSGVTAE